MKNHWNLTHLVSIKVFDFDLSPNLFYVPERKNWRGKIITEHLQYRYRGAVMKLSLEKYKDIHVVGHRVYFKPKVILEFLNDNSITYTFNTHIEATDKAHHIRKLTGQWTT